MRSGALDVIISCGFISRSYFSNCLVLSLFNPYLFPRETRGIVGNSTIVSVDLVFSRYSSTESQNVLLVFGLAIIGVVLAGKPDNSRCELY